MNYYKRLVLGAIVAGVSLNTFCIKQGALKGALRSMFFKLWRKLRKSVVIRAAVQFIGKGYTSTKKVGTVVNGFWYCEESLLSGSKLEWFVNAGYTVVML